MKAEKSPYQIRSLVIYFLASAFASVLLAACTTKSEVEVAMAVPILSATPESSPTPVASLSITSPVEEVTSRINAIGPVTIYSGPGNEFASRGSLETGDSAQVIETLEGNWMKIVCPDDIVGNCWVLWDPNTIYLYEGPAVTLNIPDPASLKFETVATETSPDGRWQALVTKSEPVLLIPDNMDAWFFYVELKVTLQDDGKSWTPVSEWHAAGLGQEEPPRLFHWSKDGLFLYYTSLSYPDGGCVFYDNIGDSLDRLDLTNGSVTELKPPYPLGILAISPDETMIAYLHGEGFGGDQFLVVRDLAAAYGDDASQDPIKREISLDAVQSHKISEIAWSPDKAKVVVRAAEFNDLTDCQPSSIADWELNVETGEFVKTSPPTLPPVTP